MDLSEPGKLFQSDGAFLFIYFFYSQSRSQRPSKHFVIVKYDLFEFKTLLETFEMM